MEFATRCIAEIKRVVAAHPHVVLKEFVPPGTQVGYFWGAAVGRKDILEFFIYPDDKVPQAEWILNRGEGDGIFERWDYDGLDHLIAAFIAEVDEICGTL